MEYTETTLQRLWVFLVNDNTLNTGFVVAVNYRCASGESAFHKFIVSTFDIDSAVEDRNKISHVRTSSLWKPYRADHYIFAL